MHRNPRSPLASVTRAVAALAAVATTCSLFYGVIAGMAEGTAPGFVDIAFAVPAR